MRIKQVIFCGAAVLLLSNHVSADDLTGQWAGLAPEGLVFQSGSGKCNADLLLDLVENGGVLSGTVRSVGQVVTDGCLTQNYFSQEVATNHPSYPSERHRGRGHTLVQHLDRHLPQWPADFF